MAFPAQNLRESFSEIDFVVDDENGLTHVWLQETRAISVTSSRTGRMIRTLVPFPSALST